MSSTASQTTTPAIGGLGGIQGLKSGTTFGNIINPTFGQNSSPVVQPSPQSATTFTPQSGLLGGAFPSTPVKTHTISTNPDGTQTQKTEYHAPDPGIGLTSSQVNSNLSNAGFSTTPLTPSQQGAAASQAQYVSGQNQTQTDPNSYQGLINQSQNLFNQAASQGKVAIANEMAPNTMSGGSTQSAGLTANSVGATQVAQAQNTLQSAQGLSTLAGLAPDALRYGSVGSATGISPQNDISTLATSLANGTSGLGYTQAYNQLSSAYGAPVANQLLAAVQKINPNFNAAQSDAQISAASTNTTTAGTTNALIDKANGALGLLPNLLNALSPIQTTGSGTLSGLLNSASDATGVGATATRAYQAGLAEARAAVNSVLNSAISLGIVNSGTTANDLLPDGMSAKGLAKQTQIVQTLMQQTKDALAKLSNASPTSSSNNPAQGQTAAGGALSWNGTEWVVNQ